jgi:hypothetical protein
MGRYENQCCSDGMNSSGAGRGAAYRRIADGCDFSGETMLFDDPEG